jgi:hypothetical protein
MKKALVFFGKTIAILLSFSVVAFIGLKIYFFANSGDEELLDNSHLVFETINIPDEKNGWFELKKAGEKMHYPEDKSELITEMVNGEAWDQKLVDELVEKNQEALEYFNKSAEYDFIVNPSRNNLSTENLNFDTVFESIPFYRNINKLNLILAKNEIKRNNLDRGISRFISSISVSYKIADKNILFIEYLLTLSVNTHNHSAISNTLNEISLRKDESIILQRELEKNKENLAYVFKGEFWNTANSFQSMYKSEDLSETEKEFIAKNLSNKSNFYLKPNKHLNALNKIATRNVENSYRSCNNLIPFETVDSIRYENPLSLFFTENAISKILIRLTSVNLDSIHKKRCAEDFDILALQVKLAANAFRNDNKRYPNDVEEIKKDGYLVAETPDSINGWDLKYDKSKGELINLSEL